MLAEIAERLSQLTPSVQTGSDRKEHVRITLKSEEVRFRFSTLNLVLWHSTKTIQVASWMILNLADERAEIRLDITKAIGNAHEFEMLDPLTSRRTISKLDLSGAIRPPRAILDYLSAPNPSLDGRTRWLWPDLTEIAVPACLNDLPLVLRMLRGRAQAVDLPGSVRPHRISKLCLVEYETYSLDTRITFTKIVQVMTENGGSLRIADWGGVEFE
ncbi:hypothetical protein FS837_004658 [Tulasnella sp. UAMH 9824]|nr:hypothetical protein FS837_004658 [Tulasnella sp. UAMH 9824]